MAGATGSPTAPPRPTPGLGFTDVDFVIMQIVGVVFFADEDNLT